MTKYISELKNGDSFHTGAYDYLFVGKTTYKGTTHYIGCNQYNGVFTGFPGDQLVNVPRPKPVRTDFWYKRKFVELVYGTTEHHNIEVRFNKVCSHLNDTICKGCSGKYAAILELDGDYYRSNYVMTANYKRWDGVTIMLINTVTGKSVACKHIDPDKVNRNNVQFILFDLYKKYMNQ